MTEQRDVEFGDWLFPRVAQAVLDYYAGECSDMKLKAELLKLAEEVRLKRKEMGDG